MDAGDKICPPLIAIVGAGAHLDLVERYGTSDIALIAGRGLESSVMATSLDCPDRQSFIDKRQLSPAGELVRATLYPTGLCSLLFGV